MSQILLRPPSPPADLFLDAARLSGGALVPGATSPAAIQPSRTPGTSDADSLGAVPGPGSVGRPLPPPGTGAEKPLKRSYQIRPDQDRALGIALAKQQLGQDVAHGDGQSQIIQALLDLHGYNARYLEGEPLR